MDIKLVDGSVVTGCVKVKEASDIKEGSCRVFYELGSFTEFDFSKHRWVDWRRSGKFKEIKNVSALLNDPRISKKRWIKHHNFYIHAII